LDRVFKVSTTAGLPSGETLARRALELFDIIGEEGIGLWTIDQELGKLQGKAAASALAKG
jgi:ferritin